MRRKPLATINRPFVRVITVDGTDNIRWAEVLWELGLEVYESPWHPYNLNGETYIISNQRLTYGWFVKNVRKYFSREAQRWAEREIIQWHRTNEELDTIS